MNGENKKGGIVVDDALLKFFFSSLASAVTGETLTLPEGASSDFLSRLFALAESQELTHVVAFSLKNSGLLPKGEALSAAFQKKELLALYTTEKISYETSRLSEVLDGEGIPYLPLKGAKLRLFYPEGFLRLGRDVDVLVKKVDCERAIECLVTRLSYERGEDVSLHDHKLVSRGGVNVELHYALMDGSLFPRAQGFLDRVWEDSLPVEGKNAEREMGEEEFLLFHLIHMAKHFVLGGCGVRPFLDLFVLKKKMPTDEARLSLLLKETGMEAFYQACLFLCSVWFEGKEHHETSKNMERYLLSGGLFGSFETEAAMSAARSGTRRESLLKAIFLPRENLELLYPVCKEKPYLLPLCQVRRWFGIFNPKRREKLRNIARASDSVTKDKRESLSRLLTSLELK